MHIARQEFTLAASSRAPDLAQLEDTLKNAKPIQFKENIALVLKHFEKLASLMQEQD
jgi:hypothetical protein